MFGWKEMDEKEMKGHRGMIFSSFGNWKPKEEEREMEGRELEGKKVPYILY